MDGSHDDVPLRSAEVMAGDPAGESPLTFESEPVTLAEAQKNSKARTPKDIKVRLFEARDREAGRALLRQHHANTVFRDQPFSDWKANRHMDHVLQRPPRMVGLAADCEGQLVGLAWAGADSYMLSDGPLFVTVQLIAVELEAIGAVRRAKTFLALVSAIRMWAASLNASHSIVHVTTGFELAATDRLMKAAGAKCIGGAYVV